MSQRVVSGMRPTGPLHLGHYHGVMHEWLQLQQRYECLFFVADWHALTTEYEDPKIIQASVQSMVIDWLAVGINPSASRLFMQSRIPEHAELHLLLSMITPLSWLERVPSYKDQQEKIKGRDLATYGFLGYPLLQTADIIIYKASQVPVGEDQVAHVELAREVARRFNHLYGREPEFVEKAEAATVKLGKKKCELYHQLRKRFQEHGDVPALHKGRALLEGQRALSVGELERLRDYLEGSNRTIFPEPEALLSKASKFPGLDGQKMSSSYHNTITLREPADSVDHKLRTMPTDPARARRRDPGNPERCPVWPLHQIYSDDKTQQWVQEGCRQASIGCLDCKKSLIERIQAELEPIRERGREYEQEPDAVQEILREGNEAAREIARGTLKEARKVMGLSGKPRRASPDSEGPQ